jgi:hypothetical protein
MLSLTKYLKFFKFHSQLDVVAFNLLTFETSAKEIVIEIFPKEGLWCSHIESF